MPGVQAVSRRATPTALVELSNVCDSIPWLEVEADALRKRMTSSIASEFILFRTYKKTNSNLTLTKSFNRANHCTMSFKREVKIQVEQQLRKYNFRKLDDTFTRDIRQAEYNL